MILSNQRALAVCLLLICILSSVNCSRGEKTIDSEILEMDTKASTALSIPMVLTEGNPVIEYAVMKEIIASARKYSHIHNQLILEFTHPPFEYRGEEKQPQLVLIYLPLRDSVLEKEPLARRGFSLTRLPSEHVATLEDSLAYDFKLDTVMAERAFNYVKRRLYNFPFGATYQVYYFEVSKSDSIVFIRREIWQPFYTFRKFLP